MRHLVDHVVAGDSVIQLGVVCLYEWYRNITYCHNLDFTITENNPFSTAGVARGLTAIPVLCPEAVADELILPVEPAG